MCIHTQCINLRYVLHGPIHRTLPLCFVKYRPYRGTGELGLLLSKMRLCLDQRKYLVLTCLISGFCHSVNEFFALLWCYAAQFSSYWCFSTTVCPNSNGQAVRNWTSGLGLHISTDLTYWSIKRRHVHIIMSYFYRPDSWDKVSQ